MLSLGTYVEVLPGGLLQATVSSTSIGPARREEGRMRQSLDPTNPCKAQHAAALHASATKGPMGTRILGPVTNLTCTSHQ